MNLYEIAFTHYSEKDSEDGIKCLVLAENNEDVLNWLLTEPETPNGSITLSWNDRIRDNDEYYNVDGSLENYRDRMLRLHGECFDETAEVSDRYYGVTHYGWQLCVKSVPQEIQEYLIKNEIVSEVIKGSN